MEGNGELELESIPVFADREPHSHMATGGTVPSPCALESGADFRSFHSQPQRQNSFEIPQ